MDESERFGELRSLANGEPDEEAWAAICELLDEEEDGRVRDELVPYLEHHLEDWPLEVRDAPRDWGRAIARGERCAKLLIARRLVASGIEQKYDLATLLTSPDLVHIEALDLGYNTFDERALEACEHSPSLGALRWLSVSDSKMGHEALVRVVRAPALAGLTHLIAAWCEIENDGAEALADVREFDRFVRIELRGNRITPPAAQVLLSSRHFGSCRELAVGWNDIADEGVRAIARAPYLGQLEELCLENNSIEGSGVLALLERPELRNLRKLRLYNNSSAGLGDDVAVAIASCPYLGSLRVLDLSSNDITDVGKRALARSRTLHEDARSGQLEP